MDLLLQEMLFTRFCHDLSGSLGAISSTGEFINSNQSEVHAKAIELLNYSSSEAIAKLQFYRQAYGAARGAISTDFTNLHHTTENFLSPNGKIKLNWEENINPEVQIDYYVGKTVLNAITVVAGHIIGKGELNILIEALKPSSWNIQIIANAASVRFDNMVSSILNLNNENDLPQPTPYNANILYLLILMKKSSIKHDIIQDESTFNLRLTNK